MARLPLPMPTSGPTSGPPATLLSRHFSAARAVIGDRVQGGEHVIGPGDQTALQLTA